MNFANYSKIHNTFAVVRGIVMVCWEELSLAYCFHLKIKHDLKECSCVSCWQGTDLQWVIMVSCWIQVNGKFRAFLWMIFLMRTFDIGRSVLNMRWTFRWQHRSEPVKEGNFAVYLLPIAFLVKFIESCSSMPLLRLVPTS